MSQERLENPSIIALEDYICQGKDQWTQAWQDLYFTKAFPKGVQTFIEEDGRANFSQEQRQDAFRFAFQSYMEDPRKVGQKRSAWHNLYINNNGEVVPRTKLSEENIDPLARGENARLLIWGLNLTSKQYVATTFFEVSQKLPIEKKDKLYDNTFRLVTNNSPSREWIKTYNLDVKSGVDWDEVVPYIGLFPYGQNHRLSVVFREDLNLYVPKALEQFILYVIEYINKQTLPPAKPNKKRVTILPEFRQRLTELKPEVRAKINPELLNLVESLLAKRR